MRVLSPDALLAYERLGHCTHRGVLPAARVQALSANIDRVYSSMQLEAQCGPHTLQPAPLPFP
jgi:hypothetical protein